MSTRLDAALTELAAAIREEIARAAAPEPNGPERLMDLVSASATLGVSRTFLYTEIAAGRLRSLKVARRRLIAESALRQYQDERARQW